MKKRLIKKFRLGPYPVRTGAYALQHFTRLKYKAKDISRKMQLCPCGYAITSRSFELMQELTYAFSLTLRRKTM
mgnify:CR=1 FL=1